MPHTKLQAAISLLAVVLLACFSPATQPGTRHLAASLLRLRGIKNLTASQYQKIQLEYLACIDARVSTGHTAEQMNRELGGAMPFLQPPKAVSQYSDSGVRYLNPIIFSEPRRPHGLFTVKVRMGTGHYCSEDETVVLYEKNSRKRVAWLNADLPLQGHGYLAASVDVGDESPGGRLVASGWELTNCTGAWTSKIARIDRIQNSTVNSILKSALNAYSSSRPEVVAAWVQANQVTFFYDHGSAIEQVFATPTINRYEVLGMEATRVPPIALTRAGFIEEWLEMPDAEAARWSTPEAARRHHLLANEQNVYDTVLLATCPASPTSTEIALESSPLKKLFVFQIAGGHASNLKMLAVSTHRTPGCRPLSSLEALNAELPW